MQTKEFIGIKEAAKLLGYTVSTLHKKCSLKELPHYKPSPRKVYFDRNELLQWIASNRVATTAEVYKQATNF